MIYNSVAEIYEALDKTRAKLLAKTGNLVEGQKNARENEQCWTTAEILEHLAMVEGGVVRIIEKLLPQAENEGVKSDGTLNPPISFLEQAAAAKDKKFEAPKHVHPQGIQSVEESLVKLRENRQKLKNLRPRIEATDLSNTSFPHPAFGPINLYQWLIMTGLHEYRHLTQIDRILAKTSTES